MPQLLVVVGWRRRVGYALLMETLGRARGLNEALRAVLDLLFGGSWNTTENSRRERRANGNRRKRWRAREGEDDNGAEDRNVEKKEVDITSVRGESVVAVL